MEVEKRAPKGGFLQLFDWNAKSRKKLFSNKSELSDGSSSGKEKFNCSAMAQVHQVQEQGPDLTMEGSRAYNFVASMNGDDGYGTRAPGVVARLMGLDSLPTSNASENCFAPLNDPSSFRGGFHSERIVSTFEDEHLMGYGSMHNNVESFARIPVESRQPKMQIRPIERFQTEVLPPKSAKSMPSTHHRHLSPIKSPGFVPTQTAAYIMEAAAKIIEQSPQSIAKSKVPFFGSPSIPLRIRDLKEKMAAAQIESRLPETSRRPKRPTVNSQSAPQDRPLCKVSLDSENRSSDNSKNKGKSVSLAIQAKSNVQKKDVSTPGINRNFGNQKQNNEVKSGRSDKSQSNALQNVHKRTSTSKAQNVLRQNNQKQNYASDRDKITLKLVVSDQPAKKAPPANGSSGPSKTLNKVVVNSVSGIRKAQPVPSNTGNEYLSSRTKNLSRKKQPANRNLHFDDSAGENDFVSTKNERPVKCNVTTDGRVNWDAVDRKSSMDVVSFTFTSPIKRSASGSQSSSRGEYIESFCFNPLNVQFDMDKSTMSSSGLSGIGSENLSVLLEQKLKELTSRVELSPCNPIKSGSTSSYGSSLQDAGSTFNEINTMLMEHDKTFQYAIHKDDLESPYERLLLKTKRKLQGLEEVMERNDNNNKYGGERDFRYPSPSSVEPSVSDGSFYSSEGQSSSGGNHGLLADSRGIFNYLSAKNPHGVEVEAELSDSASSLSFGIMDGRDIITNTFITVDDPSSSNWELEYVRDILSNAELMFEDFALCEVHKFMTFDLFDRLEDQKTSADKNIEDFSKLRRRVLFDSVIECLGFRSEQLCGGSGKSGAKWAMLFQRKGRLAEELYREISGWEITGDLMVDELVDKDMSTQSGKWVDFEIEAFGCIIEIEKGIITSLIDELVADFSL